jgi:hypothetical protein
MKKVILVSNKLCEFTEFFFVIQKIELTKWKILLKVS